MPPSKQPTEETPYRPDYIARWEAAYTATPVRGFLMGDARDTTAEGVERWCAVPFGSIARTQVTRPNRLGQIFVDVTKHEQWPLLEPGRYLVRASSLGPWAVRVDDVPPPPEPSQDIGPQHDSSSRGLVSHVVQLLDPAAAATLIGDLFVSVAISTGWTVTNVRNDKPRTVYTRLICTRVVADALPRTTRTKVACIDVHRDGTITATLEGPDQPETGSIDRVLRVLRA